MPSNSENLLSPQNKRRQNSYSTNEQPAATRDLSETNLPDVVVKWLNQLDSLIALDNGCHPCKNQSLAVFLNAKLSHLKFDLEQVKKQDVATSTEAPLMQAVGSIKQHQKNTISHEMILAIARTEALIRYSIDYSNGFDCSYHALIGHFNKTFVECLPDQNHKKTYWEGRRDYIDALILYRFAHHPENARYHSASFFNQLSKIQLKQCVRLRYGQLITEQVGANDETGAKGRLSFHTHQLAQVQADCENEIKPKGPCNPFGSACCLTAMLQCCGHSITHCKAMPAVFVLWCEALCGANQEVNAVTHVLPPKNAGPAPRMVMVDDEGVSDTDSTCSDHRHGRGVYYVN